MKKVFLVTMLGAFCLCEAMQQREVVTKESELKSKLYDAIKAMGEVQRLAKQFTRDREEVEMTEQCLMSQGLCTSSVGLACLGASFFCPLSMPFASTCGKLSLAVCAWREIFGCAQECMMRQARKDESLINAWKNYTSKLQAVCACRAQSPLDDGLRICAYEEHEQARRAIVGDEDDERYPQLTLPLIPGLEHSQSPARLEYENMKHALMTPSSGQYDV